MTTVNWETDFCPRRAGQVTRYHTWPRIKDQNVGEHTWQVMRILLMIWPDAPRWLIVHAMFHDLGEVGAGDMPYPAKQSSPQLKRSMDNLEATVVEIMSRNWNFNFIDPTLNDSIPATDLKIFKLCELVEMWEWGLSEHNLGNKYATVVSQRVLSHINRLKDELAKETKGPEHYVHWVMVRFERYWQLRVIYEQGISERADENV